MTLARQYFHRPKTLPLRKALFQIHLWTGLILGLYVVLISVSGAILVFRDELIGSLRTGPSSPLSVRFFRWLTDLHFNLLAGGRGRYLNGIGALFLILLSLTGAIVWWPGIRNWRSHLAVRKRSNWKRFNWNLHTAIGFWTLAFIFMWGFTGAYLAFPRPFHELVAFFTPLEQTSTGPSLGDTILRWLDFLHFGSFAGLPVKAVWAALALVPPFLFFTGLLMWWNRVILPAMRRSRRSGEEAQRGRAPEPAAPGKQIVV